MKLHGSFTLIVDIAVLDLREQRVVARIPVGAKPNGISFPQFAITSRPAGTIQLDLGDGEAMGEQMSDHG